MYGLLLRSIQTYLRATFGSAVWARVLRAAAMPSEGFEPMLPYDQATLDSVVSACSDELGRSPDVILEDVGTFLVAHPGNTALRRLLHFGGANYEEFLYSLEELPDRGRLALPGLDLPQVALSNLGVGKFRLSFSGGFPSLFPVIVGVLRAMADDYGALVLIDTEREAALESEFVLSVNLLSEAHGAGHQFELSEVANGR
jgi:hypothetical protein